MRLDGRLMGRGSLRLGGRLQGDRLRGDRLRGGRLRGRDSWRLGGRLRAGVPGAQAAIPDGWTVAGVPASTGADTTTEKKTAPERLKPFTVSAENVNCPSDDGAGKCQFPAASTGTSSFCAPTVIRTLDFGATMEAGPALTCPLIGSPAVTVLFAATVSVGLVRNSCSWTPPGNVAQRVVQRRRYGKILRRALGFAGGVRCPRQSCH